MFTFFMSKNIKEEFKCETVQANLVIKAKLARQYALFFIIEVEKSFLLK